MDFENDEELLDWDMETDENFEDILRNDKEDNRTSKLQKMTQKKQAGSDRGSWIRFSGEFDQQFPPNKVETIRKSGDGDSVRSQEMEENNKKVVNTGSAGSSDDRSQRVNSFSKYLPSYDHKERKFTILEEDDADLTSYDNSPVDFRGSLKTGNPPYKSETSCFCSFFRYLVVISIALAVGILIGFYIGYSKVSIKDDTIAGSVPTVAESITRSTFNTTAQYINSTAEILTKMTTTPRLHSAPPTENKTSS